MSPTMPTRGIVRCGSIPTIDGSASRDCSRYVEGEVLKNAGTYPWYCSVTDPILEEYTIETIRQADRMLTLSMKCSLAQDPGSVRQYASLLQAGVSES